MLENPTLEITCPIFNLGFLKPIDQLDAPVFHLLLNPAKQASKQANQQGLGLAL
jgi:hypothetical protein